MPTSPVEFALAFSTGLVAFALALSGAMKVGRIAATLESMEALRVPRGLRVRRVAVLLPVWELVLALGLLFGPGPVRTAAAAASLVTLAVFTVFLLGVLRRGEDVDCGCFGPLAASDRVTVWSVVRNAALIVASAAVLVLPSPPGSSFVLDLVALEAPQRERLLLAWALTAVGVLFLEVLLMRRRAAAPTGPSGFGSEDLEGDRVASPGDQIPGAEVVDADGLTSSLRTLGRGTPIMLVFLSVECGRCAPVAERLSEWQAELDPVLIRVVTSSRPELLRERMPQALPLAVFGARASRRALGVQRGPAAVLLGGSQHPVIASPVVYGLDEIEALLRGIREARR